MTKHNKTKSITLWAARISGSLILLFVLFFLFAQIFGKDESGEGFRNTQEIITFVLFPISTVIGLSIAYKWEGLGGVISTLGILALFVIRPELLKAFFIAFPIVPGILYIVYWVMSRDKKAPPVPSVS